MSKSMINPENAAALKIMQDKPPSGEPVDYFFRKLFRRGSVGGWIDTYTPEDYPKWSFSYGERRPGYGLDPEPFKEITRVIDDCFPALIDTEDFYKRFGTLEYFDQGLARIFGYEDYTGFGEIIGHYRGDFAAINFSAHSPESLMSTVTFKDALSVVRAERHLYDEGILVPPHALETA